MKFNTHYASVHIEGRSPVRSMIEAVLLTGLFLYFMVIISPQDPFTLQGSFPWLSLVPVFCCLFYGATFGIISLLMILGFLVVHEQGHALDDFIYREYVAGMISITFIVSVFSSFWQSRIQHDEHVNQYIRQHLEDLSRDYYLLRISHDRIEHAFISKPMTYRDVFHSIQELMLANDCAINHETGQRFLEMCCQYSSINSAALCLFEASVNKVIPLAWVGHDFIIDLDDPLVSNALEKNTVTYLSVNTLTNLHHSLYLAVIPLIGEENTIIGFFIIKEIPFWSLTHDNMEVLGVFAAVFVLLWSTMKTVQPLLKAFPECEPQFLKQYQTLLNLKEHHNVVSYLSGLVVPEGPLQETIVYNLQQQNRSLDSTWVITLKSSKLVIKILPLTSMQGMLGYQKRLSEWLKSDFGLTMNAQGLYFRSLPIEGKSVITQLNYFINGLCDVAE